MSYDRDEIVRLLRKGRAAEKRGDAISGCVGFLAGWAAMAAADGYLLMLGVGIVHSVWAPRLATIGFWASVLLMIAARSVLTNLLGGLRAKAAKP